VSCVISEVTSRLDVGGYLCGKQPDVATMHQTDHGRRSGKRAEALLAHSVNAVAAG